jgi:hypothetical protein
MTEYTFHPAVLRNIIAYAAFQKALDDELDTSTLDYDAYLASEKALYEHSPILYQQSHAAINLFTQLLVFAYWATKE